MNEPFRESTHFEGEWISFVLGETSARRKRELERHLQGCGDCRSEVESLVSLVECVRATPPDTLSHALERRLLEGFRTWKEDSERRYPVRESALEVARFLWAYARFRFHRSLGFRVLTLATAIAVHAVLFLLVAGITFSRPAERKQLSRIDFILPATLGEDDRPQSGSGAPEVIQLEPEVILGPTLAATDRSELIHPPIMDTGTDAPREPWSIPMSRENLASLTRWVLFARFPGDLHDRVLARNGGTPRTEQSVQRGLSWLSRHQDPSGAWQLDRFGGYPRYDVGATSLALLAFLGGGHSRDDSPFRPVIDRSVSFLIASQNADGLIGEEVPHEPTYLYNHALATHSLVERYLMTPGLRELEEPVRRSMRFLLAAQNEDGGWRFTRSSVGSSDSSVTIWVLGALRLARVAGLAGAELDASLRRAQMWLVRVTAEDGGTGYQSRPEPGEIAIGRTAGAFLAQSALDRAWAREVPDPSNLRVIRAQKASLGAAVASQQDWLADWTLLYYYSNAMFRIGGEPWNRWNERLPAMVLAAQAGDGSFPPCPTYGPQGGRIASTAFAILTLEIYYRYPPYLN